MSMEPTASADSLTPVCGCCQQVVAACGSPEKEGKEMRSKKFTALATGVWLTMLAFSLPAATFTATEVQKLVAGDATAYAGFGSSIALSGNTAVIGANGENENRGAAYVFTWNGSAWVQQAKLTVAGAASWDRFGSTVAIDGGTIVIGAPGESDNAGGAYVFAWDGSAWTQQTRLDVPNPYSYRGFGNAAIVAGDTAMVTDLDGTWGGGAVHVFTRTGTSWELTGKLLDPDGSVLNGIGHAMAIDGDRIVVGAQGGAYVFTWSGSAGVPLGTPITGPAGVGFGDTVAINGDTVVIGARYDSGGAAYVLTWNGGTWTQQAKLTSADCGTSDQCGGSVAVQGDIALVGAQFGGTSNEGSVHVFTRAGGLWTLQGKLEPSPLSGSNYFGVRIAMRDATAMVGALGQGLTGPAYSGSVHVFSMPSADGPPVVSNALAGNEVFPEDVILTATATDAESIIESAEYTLDDGDNWISMVPVDGAFNGAVEDLTATLSGLSVGIYTVCVSATDANGKTSEITGDVTQGDCASFEVTAAELSIAFTGELLNIDGDDTVLNAQITGPDACAIGAEVSFYSRVDDEAEWEPLGDAVSGDSGVATLEAGLLVGVYDIKVQLPDQFLDGEGDTAPECLGDSDTGITVVADARASSTGGGWYKIDSLTPPRVNFGYTAQTKYNKKLREYSTSGNLLWMHQDNYRLKGTINAGGKLPDEACPEGFATCAAFAGEGTLYRHNETYDPDCVDPYGCEPEWINAIPNNPFIFFVNDGGVVLECLNKKKCKEVEQADQFGIEIALESIPAESNPVYLNGGNLVVR
jgi:hypothetical protein